MTPGRGGEGGFTLIEVLIALALFSLIGVAGFTLLNAIVGVQARTDQRLERLAELQRALHVLTLDFQQIEGGSLGVEGAAVSLRRASATGGNLAVRYDWAEDRLRRTLEPGSGGAAREQTLITGVTAFRWRFFTPGRGWVEAWPPPGEGGAAPPLQAISAEITLGERAGGLSGPVRRVVRLPAAVAL